MEPADIEPTEAEFGNAYALVTIACVIFGCAFLAVAFLSSVLGDEFINVFFGGL